MTNAIRDENSIPVWLGVSCVDGVTLVPIKVNSTNGGVKFDATTVITVTPAALRSLPRDENNIPSKGAVSTAGATLILPLFVNPATGAILTDA